MLSIGLLTALAIIVSQLFYFQASAHAKVKKETKTEQQEQQNGDDTYVSLPSTSLPSSSHVELQQETFCLFEIILEDKESVAHDADFGLPINQFFQTLFGAIISPNAP